MIDVLALTTNFDFSGMNCGDEENFATFDLDKVLAWLDGDDDAGKALEEDCRFVTYSDLDGTEAAELRAGKMVSISSEQTQVVLAPVIANKDETEAKALKRIQAAAGVEMADLCHSEKGHPWD